MISIIIHGGAWDIPPNKLDLTFKGVETVLTSAFERLMEGLSALDVVEYAVMTLEDNPIFDAGIGSYQNANGEVEMDAIIVDGTSLDFGSVAGISHVQNPICVARAILETSEHCMLVGKGAEQFARSRKFEYISTEKLLGLQEDKSPSGTVGAVALDSIGRIAAATSTGGIPNKLPGRVGDTPLIGCGAIAENDKCGVSATGEGEALMKVMISREILDLIVNGYNPMAACNFAIEKLAFKTKGRGGVICLDKNGEIGYAFNTPKMAIAFANSKGEKQVML